MPINFLTVVLVLIPAALFYLLLGVAIYKVSNKGKQSEEWHEDDGK